MNEILTEEQIKRMNHETIEIILPYPIHVAERDLFYLSDSKEYEHYKIVYNLLSLGLIHDDYDIRLSIMKKEWENLFSLLAKEYGIIRIPRVKGEQVGFGSIYFSSNITDIQKQRIALWIKYFLLTQQEFGIIYEDIQRKEQKIYDHEDQIIEIAKEHKLIDQEYIRSLNKKYFK